VVRRGPISQVLQRDFVDFIRNIGQPPDRNLGGGSFGYGKAAFYLASRARTILVDTLCASPTGDLERRFIGLRPGRKFRGKTISSHGRHWWGDLAEGIPEPAGRMGRRVCGEGSRSARAGKGMVDSELTVAIVAPEVLPEMDDGNRPTMEFIAEALAWNFWPQHESTPGQRETDDDVCRDRQRGASPTSLSTHASASPGFVEAMTDSGKSTRVTTSSFSIDCWNVFVPSARSGAW
jgi:hypothetical protein